MAQGVWWEGRVPVSFLAMSDQEHGIDLGWLLGLDDNGGIELLIKCMIPLDFRSDNKYIYNNNQYRR